MAVVVPDEETVVDLCKDVQEAKNMELLCKNEVCIYFVCFIY